MFARAAKLWVISCALSAFALTAPAASFAQNKLYWTEYPSGDLFRADPDLSNRERLARLAPPQGQFVGRVNGLAIAGGYLYYAASGPTQIAGDGLIGRVRLDGTGQEWLFQSGITDTVTQIGVDLPRGNIYWLEQFANPGPPFGVGPLLRRAALGQCDFIDDLRNDVSSVASLFGWRGGGFAVDSAASRIYLALTNADIVSADLDGITVATLNSGIGGSDVYHDRAGNRVLWLSGLDIHEHDLVLGTSQLFMDTAVATGIGIFDPTTLDFDAVSQKLYFARPTGNANQSPLTRGIFRINDDGSSLEQLLTLSAVGGIGDVTLFQPDPADACTTGNAVCTGNIPGVSFTTASCPGALTPSGPGEATCVQPGIGGSLACELSCRYAPSVPTRGFESFTVGTTPTDPDYKCGIASVKTTTKLAKSLSKCSIKNLKALQKGGVFELDLCETAAIEKYDEALAKIEAKQPGCRAACLPENDRVVETTQSVLATAVTAARFCPFDHCQQAVCSGDLQTACVESLECIDDPMGSPPGGVCSTFCSIP